MNVYQITLPDRRFSGWLVHADKHGCLVFKNPATHDVVHACTACPHRTGRPSDFWWSEYARVVWSGGGK